jgi:hypothetical protein
MLDVLGLSNLNESHRAKPWKHKLVFGTRNFGTRNFRMEVKQILEQENFVQNLKTSKSKFQTAFIIGYTFFWDVILRHWIIGTRRFGT